MLEMSTGSVCDRATERTGQGEDVKGYDFKF